MRFSMAAVILAGGASRRMGQEKALLALPDGRSALAHVLEAARSVADPVLVAVDTPEHAARLREAVPIDPAHLLLDRRPGAGPLSALAGALRAAPPPAVVAIAVDTPLLDGRVLRKLQEAFAAGRVDIVLPVVGGRAQPLPAVYVTTLADLAERLLGVERRSLQALYADPSVRVQLVAEEDLRAVDPHLRSFVGANTPEEWQRVLALARGATPEHAALKGEAGDADRR